MIILLIIILIISQKKSAYYKVGTLFLVNEYCINPLW
jgi:hypothetical protein